MSASIKMRLVALIIVVAALGVGFHTASASASGYTCSVRINMDGPVFLTNYGPDNTPTLCGIFAKGQNPAYYTYGRTYCIFKMHNMRVFVRIRAQRALSGEVACGYIAEKTARGWTRIY